MNSTYVKDIKIIKKPFKVSSSLLWLWDRYFFQDDYHTLYVVPIITYEIWWEVKTDCMLNFNIDAFFWWEFIIHFIELRICIIKEFNIDHDKNETNCLLFDLNNRQEFNISTNEVVNIDEFKEDFYIYRIYNLNKFNNLSSEDFLKTHYEIMDFITE